MRFDKLKKGMLIGRFFMENVPGKPNKLKETISRIQMVDRKVAWSEDHNMNGLTVTRKSLGDRITITMDLCNPEGKVYTLEKATTKGEREKPEFEIKDNRPDVDIDEINNELQYLYKMSKPDYFEKLRDLCKITGYHHIGFNVYSVLGTTIEE